MVNKLVRAVVKGTGLTSGMAPRLSPASHLHTLPYRYLRPFQIIPPTSSVKIALSNCKVLFSIERESSRISRCNICQACNETIPALLPQHQSHISDEHLVFRRYLQYHVIGTASPRRQNNRTDLSRYGDLNTIFRESEFQISRFRNKL